MSFDIFNYFVLYNSVGNTFVLQKNNEIVLSRVEPESQVPETRMIVITTYDYTLH